MVRAASSLPVPLSPVNSTVAEVGATRPSLSYSDCIVGESPNRWPKRPTRRNSSRSSPISDFSSAAFGWRRRIASKRSTSTGLTR